LAHYNHFPRYYFLHRGQHHHASHFLSRQISQLEKEIEQVSKEKELNQEKLKALQSDNETLERFAREELRMTKPNEELFIIID